MTDRIAVRTDRQAPECARSSLGRPERPVATEAPPATGAGPADPTDWNAVVAAALPNYRRWLGAVARDVCGWTNRQHHDDLVQEGYVAMWRAAAAYDPTRGALPAWLTRAARLRMTDVARRGYRTWTGHAPTRGVVHVDDATRPASLDALRAVNPDAFDVEDVLAATALDAVAASYHDGTVGRALDALSAQHRRYVLMRFWLGYQPAELDAAFGRAEARRLWREARALLAMRFRFGDPVIVTNGSLRSLRWLSTDRD